MAEAAKQSNEPSRVNILAARLMLQIDHRRGREPDETIQAIAAQPLPPKQPASSPRVSILAARLLEDLSIRDGQPVDESVRQLAELPLVDEVRIKTVSLTSYVDSESPASSSTINL